MQPASKLPHLCLYVCHLKRKKRSRNTSAPYFLGAYAAFCILKNMLGWLYTFFLLNVTVLPSFAIKALTQLYDQWGHVVCNVHRLPVAASCLWRSRSTVSDSIWWSVNHSEKVTKQRFSFQWSQWWSKRFNSASPCRSDQLPLTHFNSSFENDKRTNVSVSVSVGWWREGLKYCSTMYTQRLFTGG